MEINCIAIDDEPLALVRIETYIQKLPGLKLLRTFDNAIEAITYIKENKVDLIFLDIQMEQFTGIQFLESVKYRPQVIITSAYEQYALKGFDFNVTDYLLKPFSLERFIQSVDKAMDGYQSKQQDLANPVVDYMFVKTEYRLERVDFDAIMYIEGMKDYLMVVTTKRKIMTLQNFKTLENVLPSLKFQRVHKSFIIAIDKIESVERNRIKISDRLIPISNTYKETFYKSIENILPSRY
jgi:two-component system, LytTR family, response regulator